MRNRSNAATFEGLLALLALQRANGLGVVLNILGVVRQKGLNQPENVSDARVGMPPLQPPPQRGQEQPV